MKNDEVLIVERIKELKEENSKLRDKVEGLQDRINKALVYMNLNFGFTDYRVAEEDLEKILKGE